MCKVVVLMASYNGEKYIQEQLDSIYNQEGVEVEILIRDDGSTDETMEILKQNEGKCDLKWYKGEHIGVENSFYELMEVASKIESDYYAFCDQDDVWDNDKLKIAVQMLEDIIDEPALYYCGQRIVDEKLQLIRDHTLNRDRTMKTRFVLSDFAGCTGVFNRLLLKKVIQYKPQYMLMHDTWILRVCLCLGGIVKIDSQTHMLYRQHSNNTIGLKKGFADKLRQVDLYLNTYKIEKVTRELLQGYEKEMIHEYKELSNWICNYRYNKVYKRKLLMKKNIDFCNRGLNLTYMLKVILNRL